MKKTKPIDAATSAKIKEKEEKLEARKAELRTVVDNFNKVSADFQKFSAQEQMKVNHLDGMIMQLQEDLNELRPPSKEKKKK